MKLFVLFCLILVAAKAGAPQQPVIGVYTLEPDSPPTPFPENHTYLASSYIKNLQMAGAQVIPLFFHYNQTQLQAILSQVNGVFFTGGNQAIDLNNQWTSNIFFILEYAKKQNREGDIYPIWATCLGFQAVMYATSGIYQNSTLSDIDGQDEVVEPLKVYYRNSKMMGSLGAEEYQAATTGSGVFFYHHSYCVLKQTFDENQMLNGFWHLVATSSNQDKVEFVAAVQAKQFPFFGVQFHPQKNNFQWKVGANRSYLAISSSQKFINHFVSLARKNINKFKDESDLKKRLIYNYNPIFLGVDYAPLSFMQIYEFDESNLGSGNPYGYV